MATKTMDMRSETSHTLEKHEHTSLERVLLSRRFATDLVHFLGSEEAAAALVTEIFNQARRVPALHHCTMGSIAYGIERIAALKLNPALPNTVHFIPRNMKQPDNTYAMELTIQYGYAGLRELVMRSAEVRDCFTKEVCVNDLYEPPSTPISLPLHRFPLAFKPRGRVIGYYAAIQMQSGSWRTWLMSVAEVEVHMKRYAPRDREGKILLGPGWGKDGRRPDVEDGLTAHDKMALKTCLRLLCNGRDVPLTAEVQEAIQSDTLRETAAELQGYDYAGQRPAFTMQRGTAMDELLQDLGGASDKVAIDAHIKAQIQPKKRLNTHAEAQALVVDTTTGEVIEVRPDKLYKQEPQVHPTWRASIKKYLIDDDRLHAVIPESLYEDCLTAYHDSAVSHDVGSRLEADLMEWVEDRIES